MQIEDLGGEEGLPEASKKVALIDADTLVYTACLNLEYTEEILSREFYTDDEWEELTQHPYYSEEDSCIFNIDIDELIELCDTKILDIQGATNTSSVELAFTNGGKKGFRYEVYPNYKGNRVGTRYPTGLQQAKEILTNKYKSWLCTEYEADDIVVFLKKKHPSKYVLCAIDKDVIYSVPGKHWNYYSSAKYDIDPKWVEVDKETAAQWHYKQCMMGDTNDNIPGIPGIGKKRAQKLLDGLTSACDMWKVVVNTYESKNLTVIDALTNMRLVNMHQLYGDETKPGIELWRPPCQ